jgi:hypothetical protein
MTHQNHCSCFGTQPHEIGCILGVSFPYSCAVLEDKIDHLSLHYLIPTITVVAWMTRLLRAATFPTAMTQQRVRNSINVMDSMVHAGK